MNFNLEIVQNNNENKLIKMNEDASLDMQTLNK